MSRDSENPLLETSRAGYLSAISQSSYSFVSMVQRLGPLLRSGGSFLCLSYMASERVIPGYGGGMSSAKAALEVLYEELVTLAAQSVDEVKAEAASGP